MLMFQGDTPPTPPLIQIVIEQKIEQPKEPTLEEKIATNYYQCDETRQYIRADTADCLDKPQYRASTQRSSENSTNTPLPTQNAATASVGWYKKGQCTWYVSTRRVVGQWNDASSWVRQAKADGYTISATPIAGAIGQVGNHVVYVEAVNNDGTVTISEANYDYRGSIRTITVSADKYTYIY